MAQLIERFLEMMSAERGLAKNSIAAYRNDLNDYCGFLSHRKTEAGKAAAADVRDYLAALDARGMARSSTSRKLSAVKFNGKSLPFAIYARNPRKRV